ncbi:MAG: peptidoglycan bridge formation glycyltransferase FemA/FemB family protein [Patescibacteria group bacterium]
MELFYFKAAAALDNFVKEFAGSRPAGGAEFLQSWAWGEILRSEGQEIKRLGVFDNKNVAAEVKIEEILAAATLVKKKLFGPYFYWYAPRGPLFKRESLGSGENIKARDSAEFLAAAIKKLNSRALFLRLEPADDSIFKNSTLKKTSDLEPAKTLILDLSKNTDELLLAMHQKTRYNLRLAQKKGIKIVEGGAADFPEFWRLLKLTSGRDSFRLHAARHYQNLLGAPSEFIKLFFAEYEGRKIAAGLFSFWGDRVTYLHGASDNQYRQLMAPYLLQWSLIKLAQNKAYKYYDFYGIAEAKWPGVTRFKLGFGGQVIDYPGTFDLIFCPKIYAVYFYVRRLKRKFARLFYFL